MTYVKKLNLEEWAERLRVENEDIESELVNIEVGSNDDVLLSTRLGKNRTVIDAINHEIELVEASIERFCKVGGCL